MPGAVIPAWTRESRRHGWQINRRDDAGLNRRPRPHSSRPQSVKRASSVFNGLARNRTKDSGFRIGEEYSRYASLFLYRTE